MTTARNEHATSAPRSADVSPAPRPCGSRATAGGITMKRRRPSPPFPFDPAAPDPSEALRHHELLQTHLASLRPEFIREVPRFAEGLSLSAWRALLVAMDRALIARRVIARFAGDHFRAVLPDGRACELGLVNLSARCREVPEPEIPARVEAHLRAVLVAELAGPPSEEPLVYESIAPRLIAQVYREESLGTARDRVVTRSLCDGLVSVLAVDLGVAIATIHRDFIEPWGRSEDSLFRLGVENLGHRPVERLALPSDDLRGFMLFAEDIALCAQVQRLSAHLGHHHRAGVLVAMPSRHTLLCIPMSPGGGEEAWSRVARAVRFVDSFYQGVAVMNEGEAMFSSDLYWWHEGRLHAFPTLVVGDDAAVMPPEEFCAALMGDASSGDLH